jgi:hypothetical protein
MAFQVSESLCICICFFLRLTGRLLLFILLFYGALHNDKKCQTESVFSANGPKDHSIQKERQVDSAFFSPGDGNTFRI